jgi:hypothetical protein
MLGPKDGNHDASRRTFLKQMGWAPVLFLPAPIHNSLFRYTPRGIPAMEILHFPFAEATFSPHYPSRSPLDDILRLVNPGTDEYKTEGYASELTSLLAEWGRQLKVNPPAAPVVSKFIASSIQSTGFRAVRESHLRPGDRIEVLRREFGPPLFSGARQFLEEIKKYFAQLKRIETADFEIYECRQVADSPLTVEARIRYD